MVAWHKCKNSLNVLLLPSVSGETAGFIYFCFRTAPGKLLDFFALQNEAFIDRFYFSTFLCSQVNLCSLYWNQRLFSADSVSHSLSRTISRQLVGIPSGNLIKNGRVFLYRMHSIETRILSSNVFWGRENLPFSALFAVFFFFFFPLFVESSTTDEMFQ